MPDWEAIKSKFEALCPFLNERQCRLWAASEALDLGCGGITWVAQATGMTRRRIRVGIRELQDLEQWEPERLGQRWPTQRIRRSGGGRKSLLHHDPTLLLDLVALVEPDTYGDPQSALRWTSKSLRKLTDQLHEQGHAVSTEKVRQLLGGLGYRLQGTRKCREESAAHPDRNAQFEHIHHQIKSFEQRGQPVISVDAKKKELVGDFHHAGREWRPQGCPPPVRVHDFPDPILGKAIPYGVYDVLGNCGWVSVGIDHDTPAFAGATVRHWWQQMGAPHYPQAAALLLLADGGGSNSYRSRGWKLESQRLADETSLAISVCHFPPGTSKWNKIEHRMFSYISLNWRGRPLVSHEVIVNLIANTTTHSGLRIQAALDADRYPTGIKITDAEMATLRLQAHDFHGEWNYTLLPRATSS